DTEIEIKRAGRPRARPLVIRRGRKIPKSHRLDGGSMHRHLVFEAKNSAFLSRVYREIHGVEAPICRTLAISRIVADGAIEAMEPAQAIQLGTTSFRLDVIERYLRPRGGESFVARNSGLRKVWQGGKWRVRVIFMDHDALSFASVGVEAFRPHAPITNAELDARQILGARGELVYLRDIYRAPAAVQRRGTEAFRAAMK